MNFEKLNGLIPAIIQEPTGGKVLMTGFMNEEALQKTRETSKVTFFSRTRNTLWTKGETSGNFLKVIQIYEDCDNDTLLIYAEPSGPDSGISFVAIRQQLPIMIVRKIRYRVARIAIVDRKEVLLQRIY